MSFTQTKISDKKIILFIKKLGTTGRSAVYKQIHVSKLRRVGESGRFYLTNIKFSESISLSWSQVSQLLQACSSPVEAGTKT